jgi:aryl-alcohol dehydrogenase-like predicted oxidoreductase
MNYRTLGRTGLQVSEVGYGAWGIGGKQWLGGSDDESAQALRRAIDLGLNFIDTALAYGEGHSEQLVGQVVRQTRARVYVGTKIPPKNQLWPARPGVAIDEVFPYDYAVQCTEQSLRNLGLNTIDLQQFHVWNPEWLERDEWQRTIQDLKQSGKVRFFGISINDHDPDSALDIINTGLIDTVQVIYNIFDQSPERNLFPLTRRENIGVLARVPLDEGSLTGTVTQDTKYEGDEFRAWYFRGDRRKQVVEHVNALRRDLDGVSGSLAEIALQFVLSNPAVTTVIPGMRRVRNVESNVSVSNRGSLPPPVLQTLKRHAWNKNFYS